MKWVGSICLLLGVVLLALGGYGFYRIESVFLPRAHAYIKLAEAALLDGDDKLFSTYQSLAFEWLHNVGEYKSEVWIVVGGGSVCFALGVVSLFAKRRKAQSLNA